MRVGRIKYLKARLAARFNAVEAEQLRVLEDAQAAQDEKDARGTTAYAVEQSEEPQAEP